MALALIGQCFQRSKLEREIVRARTENANLRAHARTWLIQAHAFRVQSDVRDSRTDDRVKALPRIETAPDTCRPLLAQRDSAITEITGERNEYRDSLDVQIRHTAELAAGLKVDDKALSSAEKAAAPGLIYTLLHPKITIGAFAGIDVNGRPNAILGGGIGYNF